MEDYSQELVDRFEQALEEGNEKVLAIVDSALYNAQIDFIFDYTLPAMIDNRFAPAFGWGADFSSKSEYMEFADGLVGEEGWSEKRVLKWIKNNIEDFKSREEIEEYKEFHGGKDWLDDLAEEIFYELELDDVIEILRKDLKDFLRKNRDNDRLLDWIDKEFDPLLAVAESSGSLAVWELLDTVKEYGFMDDLEEALGIK